MIGIKLQLLLPLISFFILPVLADNSNSLRIIPIKLDCSWDESLVTNASCSMRPHPISGGIITVMGTFVKPAHQIWAHHVVYQKMGKKGFKPNFINVVVDLCDFYRTAQKTMFNQVMVEVSKGISHLIHACPYSGRIELKDMVLAGGQLYLRLLRPLAYRLDYRVFNEKNVTYFHLKFNVVVGTKLAG